MIKYEYKVMSFYNDKYGMEDSLNKLAEEGWRLIVHVYNTPTHLNPQL